MHMCKWEGVCIEHTVCPSTPISMCSDLFVCVCACMHICVFGSHVCICACVCVWGGAVWCGVCGARRRVCVAVCGVGVLVCVCVCVCSSVLCNTIIKIKNNLQCICFSSPRDRAT